MTIFLLEVNIAFISYYHNLTSIINIHLLAKKQGTATECVIFYAKSLTRSDINKSIVSRKLEL